MPVTAKVIRERFEKENVIWINILATKAWVLNWFNKNLLNQIKKLDSVYEVLTQESSIWKECWLTKDWFARVWTIKFANEDVP